MFARCPKRRSASRTIGRGQEGECVDMFRADDAEVTTIQTGHRCHSEALRHGTEIFHALKSVLKGMGLSTAVGDEGGFAPNLPSNAAALDTIAEAVGKAGFILGRDIFLGHNLNRGEILLEAGAFDLS